MNAATPLRYAGFWRRFVAYGIDSSIVQLIAFVVIWLLGSAAYAQSAADAQALGVLVEMGWLPAPAPGQSITDVLAASGASGMPTLSGADMLIGLMISAIYNIWFTASYWQATPGKRWCGLQVMMTSGMPVSLTMSAVRWLASGVSWLPLGWGYIMVATSREKTAMHDVICGTRVVYR